MSTEDDYLMISGLQHFAFCRRQWALIHIEQQWAENHLTTGGNIMHRRAHDQNLTESRKDCLIVRGLRISSAALGFTGSCDVVEFHRCDDGITLAGREGTWLPYPVEYKHGEPKEGDCDILQLCAQAICLEEMLCCSIPEGALFYGETKRRLQVEFTEELRERVRTMCTEMQEYYRRGYTPSAKPSKKCNACSLKDICLPKLTKVTSVADYLAKALREQDETPA